MIHACIYFMSFRNLWYIYIKKTNINLKLGVNVMNKIFNVNDIVEVPKLDLIGKIIDCQVTVNDDTVYLVVFDNGTFDSFLGIELNRIN